MDFRLLMLKVFVAYGNQMYSEKILRKRKNVSVYIVFTEFFDAMNKRFPLGQTNAPSSSTMEFFNDGGRSNDQSDRS